MTGTINPLGPRLPDVQRIALLRGGGLGDLVFVLPAAQALRTAYPDAELVLLGTQGHAAILRERPGPIDRVEILPTATGVFALAPGAEPDAGEQDAFFHRVTARPIDLAVQAHGGGRWSNPLLRRLGARHTIGARSPDAVALDRWLPYRYHQHEALRWLEVVELVGATGPATARLTVTERDRREADACLAGLPRPLVVVHPGATDPRRCWPERGFAEVVGALVDAGCGIAVIGTPDEAGLVDLIVAGRRAVRGLAGALSLSGLVGVLDRADVVLANDSGPRHLAEAVGTPTIGLFWCGNMINAGPLGRARNRVLIGWTTHCPVCGARLTDGGGGADCGHEDSWIASIAAPAVIEEVLTLLAEHSVRPAAIPPRSASPPR
ncbi:MAG TPA: glycosyltransferase family 9 protein [Pseudonocardiaceae bacterium]